MGPGQNFRPPPPPGKFLPTSVYDFTVGTYTYTQELKYKRSFNDNTSRFSQVPETMMFTNAYR